MLLTNHRVSNCEDLREQTKTMRSLGDRRGRIDDFLDSFERIEWMHLLFKCGIKTKTHFEWVLWWSSLCQLNLGQPCVLQSANWPCEDQCQGSHAHGFLSYHILWNCCIRDYEVNGVSCGWMPIAGAAISVPYHSCQVTAAAVKYLVPVSIWRPSFPGMGIPMLKIRWSRDRLIFNMGILILARRHLYIETAPWSLNELLKLDYLMGYLFSSSNDGHQGDIP